MPVRLLALLAISMVFLSCGSRGDSLDGDSVTGPKDYFYREGKITHVRYTLATPPWPTRSDAWIDFDNSRYRSWDVMTTDQWDSPFVCTSMLVDGKYYMCLPSTETLPTDDSSAPVPLAQAAGIRAPTIFGLSGLIKGQLEGQGDSSEDEFQGTPVTKHRWEVSNLERFQPDEYSSFSYCEEGVTPKFYYEIYVDKEDLPLAELLGASCNGIDEPIVGVVYHNIEFVSPDSLPQDFFDPDEVAAGLLSRYFTPVQSRFGIAYWLGLEANEYHLADIDKCNNFPDCVYLLYQPPYDESSPEGEEPRPDLELMVGVEGVSCESEEEIKSGPPDARLCSHVEHDGSTIYSAYWSIPGGYYARLSSDWYGEQSREEFVAILGNVKPYEGSGSREPPFLSEEDIRLFVADALEMVCPSKLETIRDIRDSDSAKFEYDAASGDWRGDFGALGYYVVNDLKPVVLPNGTTGDGSTYPVGGADCVKEEPTPTPQALSGR